MSRFQNKENEVVLSYHDCVLRRDDVSLLYGPHWLNDAVIGFYFEYLDQRYAPTNAKLLFISPELTQLLKLTDSKDHGTFLDPVGAKDKEFIFFPVNDCNSRRSGGGSHWSLVVFSKIERTCFYYDSSRGLNTSVARDFSRNIMNYLLERNGHFVEVDCPQQENGYDCGLFVLCFADIIAEYVIETSTVDGCNTEHVHSLVANKRQSLFLLINELKEAKR